MGYGPAENDQPETWGAQGMRCAQAGDLGANRPRPGDTPCPEIWKTGDTKGCWR